MSVQHSYTVVVGIDFSDVSDRAIDEALEVASLRPGAEVHVLYVEPDLWTSATVAPGLDAATPDAAVTRVQERARARFEAMAPHLRKRQIRRVVAHFRRGVPAETVAQLAADLDADLVVVGSHGHRGLERLFLGSVAERVSRLARCAVWIVRSKDYATAGRSTSEGEKRWCARRSRRHYLAMDDDHYANMRIFSADTSASSIEPGV
jgi:nucleotide-binding universal stress UspA family protein